MAIGAVSPDIRVALDTNILTAWRYGEQNILREVIAYQATHKLLPALTSITVFESLHGFESGAKESGVQDSSANEGLERIKFFIENCSILDFNQTAATVAAYVCGRLSKNMSRDLLKDVFIAATALAHGYGLVSRNRKDFMLIADHLPPSHPILRLAVWKH